MTVKPILFATPMAQAILKGDKTETRRLVKSGGRSIVGSCIYQGADPPEIAAQLDNGGVVLPEYRRGDVLYVRETWTYAADGGYFYRASYSDRLVSRWRPSIHMPKAAARIFLNVTDIRLERLQEIPEESARRV